MRFKFPLLALAIGAFGIGTTEFAPMGMLPVIASDLGVSIPTAGLLVSGYALGVVIGAPLLTLPTSRVPRKMLLIGLMALFTLGNLLSALSPTYSLLLGARVLTSLCHGAFFGVGSVVAASLVDEGRRAAAVANMFMGLTIANVGGVPAATWVGQHLGWRTAFGGIAALGVLAIVSILIAIPSSGPREKAKLGQELAVIKRPEVLFALATTVLGSGAMFTVFTYIAPIMQTVTGVSPATLTLTLVIYGIGLTIGNYLGGRFADRSLQRTLIVVLICLTMLLVMFSMTMKFELPAIATVFAWGIATFALVPSLQARIMQVAKDAPTLASALNIGAFNLGNALGAALGGLVIHSGAGYPWVSVAGAGMSGAALLLLLATRSDTPSRPIR